MTIIHHMTAQQIESLELKVVRNHLWGYWVPPFCRVLWLGMRYHGA